MTIVSSMLGPSATEIFVASKYPRASRLPLLFARQTAQAHLLQRIRIYLEVKRQWQSELSKIAVVAFEGDSEALGDARRQIPRVADELGLISCHYAPHGRWQNGLASLWDDMAEWTASRLAYLEGVSAGPCVVICDSCLSPVEKEPKTGGMPEIPEISLNILHLTQMRPLSQWISRFVDEKATEVFIDFAAVGSANAISKLVKLSKQLSAFTIHPHPLVIGAIPPEQIGQTEDFADHEIRATSLSFAEYCADRQAHKEAAQKMRVAANKKSKNR